VSQSQDDQENNNHHFFLAVAVIRKLTNNGAVMTGQRVFTPKGLSTANFIAPPRERDWIYILGTACSECSRVPREYWDPQEKFLDTQTFGEELVTMVYLLDLNGFVGELLRTVHGSIGSNDAPHGLMTAINVFDDPLVAIYEAIDAKIRFLKIPPVIPFGMSELDVYDVYEEQ